MVELEVVETLGVTEKVFGGLPITFLTRSTAARSRMLKIMLFNVAILQSLHTRSLHR
jgi:hypothetical protein